VTGFDALAEIIAPTRCAGCELPGVLLCDRCRASLPLIDPERACPRCGAPGGVTWCGECCDAEYAFATVRCAGVLEPPLSRMVTVYKDAGEMRIAPLLAAIITGVLGDWAGWLDAVVPVPPSPAAVARRGFDHTARIAAELGLLLGVPAYDALACRPRRDQRRLSRRKRLTNAAGSITALPGVAPPQHLLLIDDVFTTGATLDAAARALLDAGAHEVRAVTVGRACG
jgi:predicted amidophosphoribosyltransferase